MKKSLILCAVAALVAAGCAKNAVPERSVQEFPDAPWVNDQSLPVPIEFGDTPLAGMTKAAIVEDNFTGVEFGVFAIDTVSKAELFLTRDVVARSGGNGVRASFIDNNGSPITRYYRFPQQDPDHTYTFYAFHTTDEKLTPSNNAHSMNAGNDYTIDVAIDSTDILWAKAVATPFVYHGESVSGLTGGDTVNGFNARYARAVRKENKGDEFLPNLRFEHLTSAIHIKALAVDEDAADSFISGNGVELVQLTSLQLNNVYTNAILNVLDGTLEPSGTRSSILHNDKTVCPTAAGVEYEGGFFILPTDANLTVTYTVNVATSLTGNTPEYEEITGTSTVRLPANGSFEKGKSYLLKLWFRSLEQIGIIAEVQEWVDGGEDDLATIG